MSIVLRKISATEFAGYWQQNKIKNEDMIIVGKYIFAKKSFHSSPTDMQPIEIVVVDTSLVNIS